MLASDIERAVEEVNEAGGKEGERREEGWDLIAILCWKEDLDVAEEDGVEGRRKAFEKEQDIIRQKKMARELE